MNTEPKNGGRILLKLQSSILQQVSSGKIPIGSLVPSVRQLSHDFGVSSKTAHRALKALALDGVVVAEPYRGYRVVRAPATGQMPATLAYVLDTQAAPEAWEDLHRVLLSALQSSSHIRGWPMLSLGLGNRTPAEVVSLIKASRAFGVALDLADREVIDAIRAEKIPAVMVDCGLDNAGIDVLIQDGQSGGAQAVEHLVSKGCRRIAWAGNTRMTAHSKDRLSGALIALHCAGLTGFQPDMIADMDPLNPDDLSDAVPVKSRIRRLLSGPKRPDGVLALWAPYTHLVNDVALELGLVPGRDIHLVGWCAAELYDSLYRPGFGAGPIAPAITWRAHTMAETAVARLTERRDNPSLPPLRIKIPTQLTMPLTREG